jgi:hypothetical protein
MTKIITIQYNEADEMLLMAFFKRLKIKLTKVADDDEGVPLQVAHNMVEGLKLIKKYEQGELEQPTWEDMMAELRKNEKEASHV